jgi:hypothetical protein
VYIVKSTSQVLVNAVTVEVGPGTQVVEWPGAIAGAQPSN